MDSDQRLVAGVLFFLIILISGVWLSRSGRPLNGILLNLHKLIALGVAVTIAVTAYRMHQAASFSPMELTAVVVTGLLWLVTGIIGGLLSTDKPATAALLRLHQITPVLTALSTAGALYLVHGR